MTISKETLGWGEAWFVTCDVCGERDMLDNPDFETPADEANDLGYVPDPVTTYKFETGCEKYKETYATHKCKDCAA